MKKKLSLASIGRILLLLTSWLLAACSVNTTASTPTTSKVTAPATGTAAVLTAPTKTTTANPSLSKMRLYVRQDLAPEGKIAVLKLPDGTIERQLPNGVPNTEWSMLYTASPTANTTTVAAVEVATGITVRSTTLNGKYSLPEIDGNTRLGGLSPDGKVLVLVENTSPSNATAPIPVSRLAVLDTTLQKPARLIELAGKFSYDTLSPDGQKLFLIEQLPPANEGHYQVRVYNLQTNTLESDAVFEKSEQTAIMEGYAGAQVASAKGEWVYTIYRNSEHGPFVHALNTTTTIAVCVDLPKVGKDNEAAARQWGLIMSSSSTLYAVNPVLGQVVEINAEWPQVRRSTTLTVNTAPPNKPHAAGSNTIAFTPDSAKLFVVVEKGLLSIDTNPSATIKQLVPDWNFDSIMVSPDGKQLYAASTEKGKIVVLDAVTGLIINELNSVTRPSSLLRIANP